MILDPATSAAVLDELFGRVRSAEVSMKVKHAVNAEKEYREAVDFFWVYRHELIELARRGTAR